MVNKRSTKNNLTVYEKMIILSVLKKLKKDLAQSRLDNMKKRKKKIDMSGDSIKIFSAIDSIKNKLRLQKKKIKKK